MFVGHGVAWELELVADSGTDMTVSVACLD